VTLCQAVWRGWLGSERIATCTSASLRVSRESSPPPWRDSFASSEESSGVDQGRTKLGSLSKTSEPMISPGWAAHSAAQRGWGAIGRIEVTQRPPAALSAG
jgi:hypothetical protein